MHTGICKSLSHRLHTVLTVDGDLMSKQFVINDTGPDSNFQLKFPEGGMVSIPKMEISMQMEISIFNSCDIYLCFLIQCCLTNTKLTPRFLELGSLVPNSRRLPNNTYPTSHTDPYLFLKLFKYCPPIYS